MAKKKSKKIEEQIQEPIVIENKSEEIVEKVEEEVTKEEPEVAEKAEEPIKEEEAPVEIKEKTIEEKIQEGAKAREEMKQAWMKRFNGDSLTNQYSYNIGNLL